MYEARAICNLLIAERSKSDHILSNLRVNKILYFIHAWSLSREKEGLIRNHFEAWPLGPVIPIVYKEFSKFGDCEITEQAKYLDYSIGEQKKIPYSHIIDDHYRFIMQVKDYYSMYSTGQLVDLSHDPLGPWAIEFAKRPASSKFGGRISNNSIRAYFVSNDCGKRQH